MDTWINDTLPDEALTTFLKANTDRQAESEANTQKVRRDSALFCAGFALIGVLGMTSALAVYIKTPVAPEPGVMIIDNEKGVVSRPIAIKETPRFFGENVRRAAMRTLIVACESYIPQTWAKIDYHNCMIHATPEEQKRRERDIGRDGPRYPPRIFAANGWAMPSDFPETGFLQQGTVGTAPNQTFHYTVRYTRTEVVSGVERFTRWSADIVFQFHPELRMNAADALVNQTGFQAVSFSTIKEPGQ